MNMKTLRLVLLLVLASALASCATGKKALQKGNYADAVFKAVERLRSNPDNKNAAATLKDGYPLAVSTMETEIDEILQSNEPTKFAIAAEKYEVLNNLAAEIRRSPAAIKIIPNPKTYTSQLTAAKDKAAEEAYQNGIRLLKNGSRLEARDAFYAFQACLNFNPSYKDARQLLDEAYELATLKVLVEPIPVPGRYKLNSDFFYTDLMAQMNNRRNLEFVNFLNPEESKRYPQVDHILILEFFEFQVGATKEESKEKQVTSADSVKVGSATVNGQKVDVYDKVKATITTHKRIVSSSGTLEVKVLDARTKKILENRKFPGTYVWETSWAAFNGDERALTKEEIELCKKKPADPPGPQDLFYEFTKPIYGQTTSFLNSYYRKF